MLGIETIKVKDFLNITHEDLSKRNVIQCVKAMKRELGFKCCDTSYYLKESIDILQRAVVKAMQSNEAITEDSELWRHDEWLMANIGTDEIEIKMMTHGYYELLFDAMLEAKICV